jgi:hypothetical protein
MQRLGNPFDSRSTLPAHLVAKGGADCTSSTCSSSCLVTMTIATVVSARLVPGDPPSSSGIVIEASPPAAQLAGNAAHALPALLPAPAQQRVGLRLAAASIPAVTIASVLLAVYLDWAALPFIVYGALVALVGSRLPAPSGFVGKHIAWMIGLGVAAVAEMLAWALVMFN